MNEPKTQVALLPEPADMTPMQMLQIAVSRGVDTEQIKQLMELQREWKADKARDAFMTAMNAFRAETLKIVKTKEVGFGTTKYKHATLAGIVDVAAPALSRHGLSHRWETKQDQGVITVSCIITHELGHSERTTLTAAPDTSGGKNSIQAIGSTVSYLQRYTFTAITGLAAADEDKDSKLPTDKPRITEKQAADLTALVDEVGKTMPQLLKKLQLARIEDLPAAEYEETVKLVQRHRK
jgi:hypothetical protein